MSNRRRILTGAGLGLALSIPLIALMYVGSRLLLLPIFAFNLFESISRIPQLGGVVTKGIDIMVSVFSQVPGAATDKSAKAFEQLMALGLFVVICAIIGVVYALLRKRYPRSIGIMIGLLMWATAFYLEVAGKFVDQVLVYGLWSLVLFLAWGYSLAWAFDTLTALETTPAQTTAPANADRRRFLQQLGFGVAAVTLGSWGIGTLFNRRASTGAGQSIASLAGTEAATESALVQAGTETATETTGAASFVIVPGTRTEITPNDQFYRVDTNVQGPPVIDEKKWTLEVSGLVNSAQSYSYDQFRALPSVEQIATLECISNYVGGDLISTTKWMGVKLAEVLNRAGLKPGVVEIKFTCNDGYTESLPLESAMDERTLLAYGMNGETLANAHGFPLRLYTPNRYGMKNPKWITKIEAIDAPYNGYWEDRGWSKDAFIKSTSVIDNIATDQKEGDMVPVGGIAFSGDRGIAKVEVSVDGGEWQPAELKKPLTPLTWVLWRFNWKATAGKHAVAVRCVDGKGQSQIEERAGLHPSGASGYHIREVDV